ncbi:MAG: cation:proton antiporter, partial [Acidimicrobiaceae bacterium]|nr:cation:proton antiporter [Acidimicrobiaceae bacterium]
FIEVGAEIGVILMLLMLGLEFSTHELIANVRRSTLAGVVDLVLNFTPGFVAGLILGFDPVVAVLLGGVTYISSSGIVAKLVADLDRIGNHETSVVLSVLVIEDLAMVLYLPIVSGVLFGGSALSTVITVAISLTAVLGVLGVAYLLGDRLSAIALSQSSEALLLTLLGGTLLVAGLAGRLGVSTAVGAFVVGVALSGDIVSHARGLLLPLRNLFAAVFFVFFGLKVDLGLIPDVAVAALAIAAVTVVTKIASGWIAAARAGIGKPGRLRAGAALIAHGEFSIVIAELGIARESDLGALAATYVIVLTLVGAVLYQFADSITLPARKPRLTRY